jgi:23S rRNA (uridine2552-2'-O)-methyltransferase
MPRPWVPDHYRQQARAEGYLARSVYKLKAIDAKHHIFHPGQRVLDLGCSPGSWLQYVQTRIGSNGLALGVDLTPPDLKVSPPLYFLQADVESLDLEAVKQISPFFDVVLSDMAPKTTGIKEMDHVRSLALARQAWELAGLLLAPGGHFLVKVFEGPETAPFLAALKQGFRSCRIVKPAGSRAQSREIYLLALHRLAGHAPDKGRRPEHQI